MKQSLILDDLLDTIKKIELYINQLGNTHYVNELIAVAKNGINDAHILKQIFKQVGTLPKVVAEQCKAWSETIN